MAMGLYGVVGVLTVMTTFLQMQLALIMAVCPLDLSRSNFTLLASLCSNQEERGKCCRYINAFVAISVAQYTHPTGNLGFNPESYQICVQSASQTLQLYGVPPNSTRFCGLGTKIPLNYECRGRTTVTQMLESPGFTNVVENCPVSHLVRKDCRMCINATIMYLHSIIEDGGNVTLITCRDAAFVALVNQANNNSAVEFARCFFGVPRIHAPGDNASSVSPMASPSPGAAQGPSDLSFGVPINKNHHPYHLTVISSVAIGVSLISFMLLVVLIFLIRRKVKELKELEGNPKPSLGTYSKSPHFGLKAQEGPSTLKRFTFKETKKATENFTTVIGQGGFATVYRAKFSDGMVVAIKRIDKVSEQEDDDICKEIKLLARLHHRHLVALKGFCIEKQERLLMYEYLENGSLKDHLHCVGRMALSWQTRVQIAIDVANALEYLHFYCDPPLCHRDIKSSNILLDEKFVAKVADFGLAHASKDGSICFEPIDTDVRGTPGYMDPEYVVTRELTEKSDIYSYGVVLMELITGRRAIQDKKNLVEWAWPYMSQESKLSDLVDPAVGDSYDFDQLQTLVEITKWCTHSEGRCRPSIKQVLRLLYECSDPMHGGFSQVVEEDEECCNGVLGRTHDNSSKGKNQRILPSADGSSSTRSYGSRSFLLENNGSPHSSPPHNSSL